MLRYVSGRLLQAIPVMVGITFICFAILYAAPGDPVRIMMGQHYDAQVADSLRHEWGLDKPFLVQYGLFALRTARGDLGQSYLKHTLVPGGKFLTPCCSP
jgi:peptide/nickel transport system permease protein